MTETRYALLIWGSLPNLKTQTHFGCDVVCQWLNGNKLEKGTIKTYNLNQQE